MAVERTSNPASSRAPPLSDSASAPGTLSSRFEGGWRNALPSPSSTARSANQGSMGFQRRSVLLDEVARTWKKQVEEQANSTMGRSASDPAVAAQIEKIKQEMAWTAPSFRTRPGLNGEFYPHAVHNRGNMQLTHMGVLNQGIDPMKNKMYRCPVYEAPPCRFARNASYAGNVPRTPVKSLKWNDQEQWVKFGPRGETEKPFKVNHVRPSKANMCGNACNGIVEVHAPSIFMSTKASQNGKLIRPGPRSQLG